MNDSTLAAASAAVEPAGGAWPMFTGGQQLGTGGRLRVALTKLVRCAVTLGMATAAVSAAAFDVYYTSTAPVGVDAFGNPAVVCFANGAFSLSNCGGQNYAGLDQFWNYGTGADGPPFRSIVTDIAGSPYLTYGDGTTTAVNPTTAIYVSSYAPLFDFSGVTVIQTSGSAQTISIDTYGSGYVYKATVSAVVPDATPTFIAVNPATDGASLMRFKIYGTAPIPLGANHFLMANPNVAPSASAVAITGTAQVGVSLAGTYTYADTDGDLEGTSTFRWLRNSVNTGIVGATSVATTQNYTAVAADLGNYLYFCVTPVAQTGAATGTEVCSAASGAVLAAANVVPSASAVAITGTAQVGATLSGTYTYADTDGDLEGSSTFRWLRNTVNTGIGGATSVATSQNYTAVAADLGNYLYFCVTPVAQTGATPGSEACSAASAAVVAVPVPAVNSVPGLSEYGVVLTSSLLAWFGLGGLRRRGSD